MEAAESFSEESESAKASSWQPDRNFSSSVNSVLKEAHASGDADFLMLLQLFFKLHGDYGNSKMYGVQEQAVSEANENGSIFQQVIDFLERNRSYLKFSPRTNNAWAEIIFTNLRVPEKPDPVINTRLFLIGLMLSEHQEILQQLRNSKEWIARNAETWTSLSRKFLVQLEKELEIEDNTSVRELLTDNGKKLRAAVFRISEGNLYETANLSDSPAEKDSLSRDALAKYLAKRLRHIYKNEILKENIGSFFMHIDGEWGSGKSTLLRFLKNHLEREDKEANQPRWIVVEFDAWRNQRLDPPWWFLMESVYHQTTKKLWNLDLKKWWLVCQKEMTWRLNTGTNYLLAAGVTLVLFLLALLYGIDEEKWNSLPIIQLLTFLGFLWSFTKFLRTSLVPGSAKAAQSFIEEHGKDPMDVLATHFQRQIMRIGYPVAIFIDNLDRCNKDYGIQLLEGLQTIFREAPVVYVIAADRKWLSTMYENHYDMFASVIAKPARPFGLVFLDKTFQLIVELPNISAVHKKNYWNSLLNISPEQKEKTAEEIKTNTKMKLESATNNEERMSVASSNGQNEVERQIVREEIIGSISIGEEEKYLKHKLQQFVDLIEPNPRAMKRIINDVSTAKALTFLYDQDVKEEQLILWTILRLQYPALAEYFWNEPERLKAVNGNETGRDESTGNQEFDALLKQDEVKRLFSYSTTNGKVAIDTVFIQKMKFEDAPKNRQND